MSDFDGATYEPELDHDRLSTQFAKVKFAMTHPIGSRWTIAELAKIANGSEAAISARIRDLRKERFGNYTVRRERIGRGLFEYWISPDEQMELFK